MNHPRYRTAVLVILAFAVVLPVVASAQVTRADYDRAAGLRAKYSALALNVVDRGGWIGKTPRYWYRKSVAAGGEFWIVDASTRAKAVAFDHARLAAALSAASGAKVEALALPLFDLKFSDDGKTLEFLGAGGRWSCDLASYAVKMLEPGGGPGAGPGPRGYDLTMWQTGPAPLAASPEAKASPDGKWEAFIRNYNVAVKEKGGREEILLSHDGSEGSYYTFDSISWGPDSKRLAAKRLRRGYHRIVHYVESSPADQLQPRHYEMEYAKPGDVLDVSRPVLFLVEPKAAIEIDDALFANPFELSDLVWRKDGRAFTFEYNERGHQAFRIIEVDGASGAARAVVDERAKTFFTYSEWGGKKFRHDLADGREVVWMSERDGWNHLYLYDGATGAVKNQITKGEWVVRSVDKVDEDRRQVYFRASGVVPGQDPYLVDAYRISLDGTGLVRLTQPGTNHVIAYSPDMTWFADTWSRVDLAPTTEIRSAADGSLVTTVETAAIGGLTRAGWRAPEVFTAKGRDGRTDIWGVIFRPSDFNPKKKYPVIEYIYAGPHDSFVPKSFQAYSSMRALAELGFIVSQCDGMGTSNRSKAFHDVCWKNLADAGFPDRILWHKAVAAKYPSYDISRVGIYGNSAGGQNTLAGLLFHPEFYKAGVSSCGCHDNRMDKIWWNEQWMGWPVGPEYAASSNVENAARLEGRLLLILGEMDMNVDPSSTMQVVNALIKAGKMFDLLVIPGAGHGMGGAYGERKMFDFFVRNLLGQNPPDWNGTAAPAPPAAPAGRR
ncbi:MAG TPA: prolyl oligopeptidase family serine peptidase [Candidatus Aminicenantes bacterium]|nr:prolyl oligopeptidase family serine peptidase [Candidatus Aminicenantes bacterium]HRZ72602.1 prolyl oligopeptidase family serine peptidase [Candidatus Aminicenantes bacterium]